MALKDIFDMVAGTSTGSILAAGLTYPDKNRMDIKKPKFFAEHILDIYMNRAGEIFVRTSITYYYRVFFVVIFVFIFTFIGYIVGMMLYDSPQTWKSFANMKSAIRKSKDDFIRRMVEKSRDKKTANPPNNT